MTEREQIIEGLLDVVADLSPFAGDHEDWTKVHRAIKDYFCGTIDDIVSLNVHMDIDAVRRAINDVPAVSGWVSVKDRLPDKNGQYLCWFGKNIVTKGAAIATYLEMWKAFGSLESLETYPNVTHWMPIEPPEENEDD